MNSRILDFHPTYCAERQRILNNPARLLIVCAGRSGGKWIYCGAEFLNRTLDKHPLCSHPVYAYCYPTRDQAHRTVWRKLTELYKKAGALLRVNESEMRIDLTNGATVYCAGLDRPERIEGQHYCGIAVDEMSDTKPTAISQSILPALNAYHGWLMILGVPKRNGVGGNYYRQLCEKAVSGEAIQGFSTSYHHWTSADIYSVEEIESYRELMDEKTFNENFLARWERNAGLVYFAFDEAENMFDEPEYYPNLPLLIGSDFNVNPMAWVICQEVNGVLIVINELILRNTNTLETLDELYRRYGTHKAGFQFYGDAAGRQNHTSASSSDYIQIRNDIRFADSTGRVRIFYPKANPAVRDRVTCVNSMLRNAKGVRRLRIWSKCRELIKDFEGITYKEKTGEVDKSDPDRTHISDALGYLVYQRYPLRIEGRPGKSLIVTGNW